MTASACVCHCNPYNWMETCGVGAKMLTFPIASTPELGRFLSRIGSPCRLSRGTGQFDLWIAWYWNSMGALYGLKGTSDTFAIGVPNFFHSHRGVEGRSRKEIMSPDTSTQKTTRPLQLKGLRKEDAGAPSMILMYTDCPLALQIQMGTRRRVMK